MRCEVKSGQGWRQRTVRERQPIRRRIGVVQRRFDHVRNGDGATHEGR